MNDIKVGELVRVVDFTAQDWTIYEGEWSHAEKNLISCYAGKIGRVIKIDEDKSPYLVEFSQASRVPMKYMRFYQGEVEDIG